MTTPVWISLGSNLGDRYAIFAVALELLNQTPGVVVSQVSSFRETLPVGGPAGQGAFLNAAARLETTLTPRELLGVTQRIETQLGRVRTVRWGERTLDVDLLIYGTAFVDEPDLKVSHPRLMIRRFVLEPLAAIAPEVVVPPTCLTVAGLLANLDRRPHYLAVDDSIQIKVPRLLSQLERLLPGVSIQNCRDFRGEPAEPSQEFRWVNWAQNHLESMDRAIKQCSVDSRERWLIKTTYLDIWSVARSMPRTTRTKDRDPQRTSNENEMRLAARLAEAPGPTLIVAAPPPRWRAHRLSPSAIPTPIYWPEATDPDAIVAEIVAVCRGIEAV